MLQISLRYVFCDAAKLFILRDIFEKTNKFWYIFYAQLDYNGPIQSKVKFAFKILDPPNT